jgi:hypothetical protein
MKYPLLGVLIGWTMATAAFGQIVMPGGAKNPGNRSIGNTVNGGVDGGATISGKQTPPKKRYTTHIILAETRIWRNADGRTKEGKLLAFEDVVVEVPGDVAETPMPVPPANPTLVRNGKVRMLIGKEIFEVAVSSLVKIDQDYIEGIRASLAKKAAVKP